MKQKTYTHIGKRANQEDALTHTNTTFVVCDGVGGHAKGEVASNFVATQVVHKISETQEVNEPQIQHTLQQVQEALNSILINNPEAEGMGTTFCGLFATKEAFYVAHIGDSRVYYIKPKSKQFWHTWDHSLVSYLVQTGEITREDARFHPQNNRISRAITAKENNKIAKADIETITHIEKGDLFFLCSDGVNEAWSDLDLVTLLMSEQSIEEKLKTIQAQCAIHSKDNNTAILLEIEKEDVLHNAPNTLALLSLDALVQDNALYEKNKAIKENEPVIEEAEVVIEKPKNKKKRNVLSFLKRLFILVGVGLLAFYLYPIVFEDSTNTSEENTANPQKPKTTIQRIDNRKKETKKLIKPIKSEGSTANLVGKTPIVTSFP